MLRLEKKRLARHSRHFSKVHYVDAGIIFRLCLTGAGLRQPRTPLPNRSKPVEMSAATPVALRDISFRAQRELASLYDDLED